MAPGEERMRGRLERVERLLGMQFEEGRLPAWLRPTQGENRLPVMFAILVAIGLQVFVIPRYMAFQPWWLLPAIEVALLVALSIANPTRINRESTIVRGLALTLVLVASLATAWSAAWLVYVLVYGKGIDDAARLLLNGGAIWLTNVIVFALWY